MTQIRSLVSFREFLISSVSLLVFSTLDLLDFLLCYFYRFADSIWAKDPSRCYCMNRGSEEMSEDREGNISETLYGRRNIFRQLGLGLLMGKMTEGKKGSSTGLDFESNRWSDCGCVACTSWQSNGDGRLHFVVKEPAPGISLLTFFGRILLNPIVF